MRGRTRAGSLVIAALAQTAFAFVALPVLAQERERRPAPSQNGSVEMEVLGVMLTDRGHVVLLRARDRDVYVPIWIGESEAYAIQNRMANTPPRRPLTHDLLETMIRTMGARVVRVEVVALRDGIFYGEVTLREPGGTEHRIDARSSDSIALALGARVPIFAASRVVTEAGVDRRTLETNGYQGTPVPSSGRHSL